MVSDTNAGPCGVVQVGGVGNTANGGNCGPPSRILTQQQQDFLRKALSPVTAKIIVWYFGSDADTTQLSQGIYDAFKEAGWEMEEDHPVPSFETEPFPYDVAVFTPNVSGRDSPSEAANEVLNALQSPLMPHLKLAASWSDKISPGYVKVVVGPLWVK